MHLLSNENQPLNSDLNLSESLLFAGLNASLQRCRNVLQVQVYKIPMFAKYWRNQIFYVFLLFYEMYWGSWGSGSGAQGDHREVSAGNKLNLELIPNKIIQPCTFGIHVPLSFTEQKQA